MKNHIRIFPCAFGLLILLGYFTSSPIHACACGCGVFDVGTSSMLPSHSGGMVFLNSDYMDQDRDWHGTSRAPADSNDDKDIRTHFLTLGIQYLFNRSWGIQAEVPYWFRHFENGDEGDITSVDFNGIGDVRIKGLYTGFSEDLSIGISLGVKLPTGSHTQDTAEDVDRDTQIGTGSTDILLGGFFRHALIPGNSWSGILQAELDQPVLSQDGYKPGAEIDESFAINYNDLSLGSVQIKPLAQIIGSERAHDTGPNASSPVASGYQRILLSPGVEFHLHPFNLYTDAEFPVYQNMNGYQMVAPVLFKASLSWMF